MKRKTLLVLAGSAVFGVSLLAQLPARLVVPESVGKLQFRGIRGSVWRGEIEQVLVSGLPLPVHELNWSLSPFALFTGTLKADFYERLVPSNRGSADFKIFSEQLELHALHWAFPMQSFDAWMPVIGVSVKGDVVIDLQTLQMPSKDAFPNRVEGQASWQNAVIQNGHEYWTIGSPLVKMAGQGGVINGDVSNSQPSLPGTGTFQCTIEECQVSLRVQPVADAPAALLTGLTLMGFQRLGNEISGQLVFPLNLY